MRYALAAVISFAAFAALAAPYPFPNGTVLAAMEAGDHSSVFLSYPDGEVYPGVVVTGSPVYPLYPYVMFNANGRVYYYQSNENGTREWNGRRLDFLSPGILVAVDQTGNFFATCGTEDLCVYSNDGAFQRRFPFTRRLYAADLAGDQCTLYYADFELTPALHRIDVCSGTRLPDVAWNPKDLLFRALGDGGVVGADTRTLTFYDRNGALATTIEMSELFFQMAFDSDPHNIWIRTASHLEKIRLADGAVLDAVKTDARVFTVIGEQRPAISNVVAPMLRRRGARH